MVVTTWYEDAAVVALPVRFSDLSRLGWRLRFNFDFSLHQNQEVTAHRALHAAVAAARIMSMMSTIRCRQLVGAQTFLPYASGLLHRCSERPEHGRRSGHHYVGAQRMLASAWWAPRPSCHGDAAGRTGAAEYENRAEGCQ